MQKSIQDIIKQSYQLLQRESDLKKFRLANIPVVKDSIRHSSYNDLIDLADHIEEIRWKYFMLSQWKIDEVYQWIAQIIISIKIKTKDLWVENYLRYFDPESAYLLRMKALVWFRLLENPVQDIESKYIPTAILVHKSYTSDPKTINKARDVLKEYIDRLFSLRFTTFSQRNSRYELISKSDNESLQFWLKDNDFRTWLLSQCNAEFYSDYNSWNEDHDDKESKSISDTNASELQLELEKSHETIQNLQNNILQKNLINDNLNNEKIKLNETIKQLQQKIEIIEKNKSEWSQEKSNLMTQYEVQIKDLSEEKNRIQSEYEKYLVLMSEVEKWQKEIEDIKNENKQLKYQLEALKQTKEDKSIVEMPESNTKYDRSLYKIDIIGWSPKVMKKYDQLQTQLDINAFGISWKQLGKPICDYEGQKKLKASVIKNNLMMWTTTFLLAIQTDHETEFANLCKDPDVDHLITVFAEDKEFTGQSLSAERFRHYLWLAINKYERREGNLI